MTAIERYEPRQEITSLDMAPKAWKLAKAIAHTEFVPKGLRGKEEAVLAAILTGHEVGIEPMTALAKIHVIEGRPSISAELMRAIVERAGHEIYPVELTTTRVTVCAKRKGSDRPPVEVTWTIDDAKRAGLAGKQVWRSYPRAMLYARATSEICRMMFPDVLAGLTYTPEELEDGVVDEDTPTAVGLAGYEPEQKPSAPVEPTPTSEAVSGHVATSAPAPAEETERRPARDRGEVPMLPGEDVDDVAEAELVEEPATADPEPVPDDSDVEDADWHDPAPVHDDGPRMSGPQVIAMLMTDRGVRAQAARRAWLAEFVGHPVESTKDLSSEEISRVIEHLNGLPEGEQLVVPKAETEAAPPASAPERAAVTPPEEWSGDRWREFLRARSVKVTEAMKQAVRLGAAADPAVTVGTLDDLAGSGICGELVGWVEDKS